MSHSSWSLHALEPVLCNKGSHCVEKSVRCKEDSPCLPQLGNACALQQTPSQPKQTVHFYHHESSSFLFAHFYSPLTFSSIQLSHSVISDSLQPHGLQHTRPPCPSPTLRVYPNSCPLSQWCHPTTSSSDVLFSSHLQSFPASGSFPVSRFFASGGQSIGVSASASVLPMNIQDWFPLGWTGWISLQSKDSQESSPTPQFKSINSSALNFLYSPTRFSIKHHSNPNLCPKHWCWRSWSWPVLWRPTRPSRTNTKKKMSFSL